jgi:hypothetical protein
MAVVMLDKMSGCRITLDSAHVWVAAMEKLRSKESAAKLPRVVVLSSASLDHDLCCDLPPFVHWMLFACASNIYAHLIKAEVYLWSQESCITLRFITPDGLAHDKQTCFALSTERQLTFSGFPRSGSGDGGGS